MLIMEVSCSRLFFLFLLLLSLFCGREAKEERERLERSLWFVFIECLGAFWVFAFLISVPLILLGFFRGELLF